MLKMFSRVNRNRKSSDYGKVELKVLSIEPPKLGTTHLTSDTRCIYPIFIDGVSGVCGNLTSGNYAESGRAHGWLCPTHYLRSMVGEFTSRQQALDNLDRDNIAFIIEQDRRAIVVDDSYPRVMVKNFGERLAPFRGWHPYLPKVSGGVHDHADVSTDDEE